MIKRIIMNSLLFFSLVASLMGCIGLIKHNNELNEFIKQENYKGLEKTVKPLLTETEVYILGTIHMETDNINRNDLYQLLDSISPSVILFESDEKTLKRILKKRDYFFQLRDFLKNQTEIEKSVTLRYLENNPECLVLPYEWEAMIKYYRKYKILKKPKKMLNSIVELHKKNQLTRDQSKVLIEFSDLNIGLRIGQEGTLSDINNAITDSLVSQRQYYLFSKIPEIVIDRSELSSYIDFIPVFRTYWDKRNKAMAENILKQIQHHPNQVIVVLNGFYHRYYLIDELKKYETDYKFTIKDI